MFGYLFAVIGFLVGLGFANYPSGADARAQRSHSRK